MSIKKEDKKYISDMLDNYLIQNNSYLGTSMYSSNIQIKLIKDPEKDLRYYNHEKERLFNEYLKDKNVKEDFLKFLIQNTNNEKMYYVYKYIKRNEPSYKFNECLNSFKNNDRYDTGYRYSNYMFEVLGILEHTNHNNRNENLYYYIINDAKFIIDNLSGFFKIFNNLSLINKKKTIDFIVGSSDLLENINFKNMFHESIKDLKIYGNYKDFFKDLNLDNKESSFDINKISHQLKSNVYEIDMKYFSQFLKNSTINEFINNIDNIIRLEEFDMLNIKNINITNEDNNKIKKIYINHINENNDLINNVVKKYIEMSLDKTIQTYNHPSREEDLKKVIFEEMLRVESKINNSSNSKVKKI